MTLGTHVCNVKEVPAGQGVSYGLRYSTDKPTTLALIPLGYADGVPRIAEGSGAYLPASRCRKPRGTAHVSRRGQDCYGSARG